MAPNTEAKCLQHGCSTWAAGAEWSAKLHCHGGDFLDRVIPGC